MASESEVRPTEIYFTYFVVQIGSLPKFTKILLCIPEHLLVHSGHVKSANKWKKIKLKPLRKNYELINHFVNCEFWKSSGKIFFSHYLNQIYAHQVIEQWTVQYQINWTNQSTLIKVVKPFNPLLILFSAVNWYGSFNQAAKCIFCVRMDFIYHVYQGWCFKCGSVESNSRFLNILYNAVQEFLLVIWY